MHTRYLIIGYQRSGTTAMHLLLAGHPRVSVFTGELREPYFSKGLTAFNAGYLDDEERAKGHSLLFDAITGAHVTDTTTTVGAKTVCNSRPAARTIVEAVQSHLPDVRVLVIERRDLVAQYGSRKMTKLSGVYHSWNDGESRPTPRIRLDRRLFKRYAVVVAQTYEALRALEHSHDYVHLFHEDLVADRDAVYRRALEFLGLAYVAPDWFGSRKVLPHASTYIADYDALTEVLEETRSQLAEGALTPREDFLLRAYSTVRKRLPFSSI